MSPDYGKPGPFDFRVEDGEWFDAHRSRRLLWKRYRPLTDESAPLVIYSHGLGGSCRSGEVWLKHWASWGIGSMAVQHPGTDEAAAGDSPLALRHLLRTAVDKAQLAARQADLLFALDEAEKHTVASDFGIAGHSYGAVSALRLVGERRGANDIPADSRLAAAILFSPSARGGNLPLPERFAGVTLPCLHLTGSADDGIGPGDIDAADRSLPYQHSCSPNQYLLVLDGAGHLTFAGQGNGAEVHVRLLQAATTAFWLGHLHGSPTAANWLAKSLPCQLAAADGLTFR
ncbi:MAG: hypothetical protein QG616_78 [Pseudomonadota bacterium]|nr:hypothetical protein [Pseudomonadota bacterium]